MDREQLITFFKALASEKRQEIIIDIFLDGNPHSVTEVAERSRIAMSTASAHLNQLKRANILLAEKTGKDVFYRGNREYMAEVFKSLADRFSCC